jgi:ATP-dependent Clp protease protease subunit
MTHPLIKDGELILYGPVGFVGYFGDGFGSLDVIEALAEMDGDIVVRINSGGGVAMDGVAIFNALKARDSKVSVYVDGVALSAASIIAMGGDQIVMRQGSLMMIHGSSGLTVGNADDHEKQIEILHKLDGQMAKIYAARSGEPVAAIKRMMNEETWFDGSEAVDKGFATQTEDNEADTPTAFDYRLYAHAPERLVAMAQPMTARARAATTEATRSPQSKGNDMDYKAVTMADLRAQRPDLVSAIEAAQDISGKLAEAKAAGAAEAKATGDAEKKAAGEQAAKAERDRIEGIRAAAFEGQDELVKTCVADGLSIGEAAQKLNADYKAKGVHLAGIKNGEKHLAGLGAAPNAGGDAGGGGKKASTPEEWKAEYSASDKLKADFPDADNYVAFKKNESRVRVLHGRQSAA